VPISVTCSHCGHTLSVKEKYAGKKGMCPKCQNTVNIPSAEPAADPRSENDDKSSSAKTVVIPKTTTTVKAPPKSTPDSRPQPPSYPTGDALREQVLAAFIGDFQPPRVSLLRKIGMLLVAGIVLVLPLFYIVSLGLLIYGLYWLATSDYGRTLSPTVFYLSLAAGILIVLCLLKPLVVPRRRLVQTYPLDSKAEPLLVELIEQVCQRLNAPRPKSIRLECSAFFGSGYRRGALGYASGDLALNVGLPLLACLSIEQFAGLVAGEVAHYRRRAGSGLMVLINAINGWLWRSVYEPDRWDERLDRATSRPGFHLGKLLLPLKGLRLFAQIVLWIPMFIGNTVASGLVRRMEFDADRCTARLAGRGSFEITLQRVRILAYTWEGILAELAFLYKEQQLPDSLPHQLQLRMVDITPELAATLVETVVKPADRPFDSRPGDAERLANVAAEPADGVLNCDLPAWTLLKDYPKLARTMTWDYYSRAFGPQLLHTALKKVVVPGM
jgi:hypothetical protein